MPEYTPIQQKILALLSDGDRHHRDEVRDCIDGKYTEYSVLHTHLTLLRKKLRPLGEDIICEFNNRRIFYRHVRLLASPYNGRK